MLLHEYCRFLFCSDKQHPPAGRCWLSAAVSVTLNGVDCLNNRHEEDVMRAQERDQSASRREKFWSNVLRLLVLYPLAWIVVSVLLFYLVKK
jgi:hypothetical protein